MNSKLIKSKIFLNYGTQSDFALAIGMDETLVSKIIRGRRKLDPEKQRAWARALNTTRKQIFGQENDR